MTSQEAAEIHNQPVIILAEEYLICQGTAIIEEREIVPTVWQIEISIMDKFTGLVYTFPINCFTAPQRSQYGIYYNLYIEAEVITKPI